MDKSDRNPILDERNPNYRNHHWNQNFVTAGVDCSGLVSRSASYSNLNYKINVPDDRGVLQKKNVGMLNNNEFTIPIEYTLSKLVPGDLIVKKGHVAIVQSINYIENTRIVSGGEPDGLRPENGVRLIHSTSGGDNEWRVLTNDKWSELGNYRKYKARRLSVME